MVNNDSPQLHTRDVTQGIWSIVFITMAQVVF